LSLLPFLAFGEGYFGSLPLFDFQNTVITLCLLSMKEITMTTLIRIGNSQGIRIPKAIIEQAKLGDKELEFEVIDEGLLIKPLKTPRKGWKEQFEQGGAAQVLNEEEQEWIDASLDDDEDWEW
jgi:antitoxin MazE